MTNGRSNDLGRGALSRRRLSCLSADRRFEDRLGSRFGSKRNERVLARLDDAWRAVAARDLVLKEKESVEHRLRPWGTARHVDVARDDFVDTGHRRIIVVEAAAARARAEREHVLRLHHLLVD